MQTRRDVFQAISDPTRRNIIHVLAQQPLSVSRVAQSFHMSRQAVSLHLRILEECGLVRMEQQGRERLCKVELSPLSQVSAWIELYREQWESQLNSLESYLDQLQKQRRKEKK